LTRTAGRLVTRSYAPMNGRLTRVPTQITCKFLKNTPNNVSVGVDRVVYPGSRGCQHENRVARSRPGRPFQGCPRSGARSIAARAGESTSAGCHRARAASQPPIPGVFMRPGGMSRGANSRRARSWFSPRCPLPCGLHTTPALRNRCPFS
jgi:hypothetical protein